MLRVAALMALSGCQLVFELHGPDAAIDQAPIDAADDAAIDATDAGIGTANCPAGYVQIPGLAPTSRFRQVFISANWNSAELDCEDDTLGTTHLACPISRTQLATIRTAFGGTVAIWIGIGRNAAQTKDQFRTLTNVAIPADSLMWDTNQPNQQTGGDHVTEIIASGTGLNDAADFFMNVYLCECSTAPFTPL